MSEDTFILTNGNGGFCHVESKALSRYNGVFFRFGTRTFKIIEELALTQAVEETTNNLWAVSRTRADVTEQYVLLYNTNVLLHTVSTVSNIELYLDCKEIFDNRVWGRAYSISLEQECLLIHFVKANDPREPNCQDEYSFWIAIAGDNMQFLPSQKWVERTYPKDQARKSPPFTRWVYYAGTLKGTTFSYGCDVDKEVAKSTAKQAHANREALLRAQEERATKVLPIATLPDHEKDLAYQCAVHSLYSLLFNEGQNGLIAGIPWFLENWPRDLAVSAHAFTLLGKPEIAKQLLFAALDYKETMKHADAPGWTFLRLMQLSKKNMLTQEETVKIKGHLQTHIGCLTSNSLIKNQALETWMDTTPAGVQDVRDGERVEINALFAEALHFYEFLNSTRHSSATQFAGLKAFWNGTTLADGSDDPTIRPNVFLAAYVSPSSLSKQEWESAFDNTLPQLWLNWGGLTSISKNHPLYTARHTGEDNVSYHRGDSWFWINNLAAIAMHRVNAKKYEKYVSAILDASTKDILYLGASGWASEISSAEEQTSEGCPAQAWSCATYIELVHEVFGVELPSEMLI